MKRTGIILCAALLMTAALCLVGIFAAKRGEALQERARAFEQACVGEDAHSAAQSLSQAEALWEESRFLFHTLCRLETCMGIERCLQEMEQALGDAVFEDAISASRELQRLCGEIGHLGLPEWSDVL